jgi:hypothetical protein
VSDVRLILGDCVQWARKYSGDPFHALFCDAPYEMDFMGQDWDASGVAFDPETWKALARPLYDGAFLFVFAGTINDDLISYAMRQAGLRKFHKMMGWVYGSGFPKASRLNHGHPLTEVFEGYRYGLQALKPAIETVLIFQKPYKGKPVDNITQTGAGVLNIDGGRIPANGETGINTRATVRADGTGWGMQELKTEDRGGRWPANFYLDEEAARRLDEQSGERPVSGSAKNGRPATGDNYSKDFHIFGAIGKKQGTLHNDTGGASRFFFRVNEQIDEADPVHYMAKASRSERDAGLEGFEAEHNILRGTENGREFTAPDGTLHRHGVSTPARNPHPTVKPLALARYLATLLLPPAEYSPRRLFIPFAGVASECIGAMQAGWEHIEGVELTEEYLPIACARVEYWKRIHEAQQQMVMAL